MENNLSKYSFDEIKKEYSKRRNYEKQKIIAALTKHDFTIMDMGFNKPLINPLNVKAGRGLSDYTSNGTISPYDLSNWQWINVEKDGHCVTISLQPREVDSKTGNSHTLFDRIGFIHKEKRPTKLTKFDLPLNSNDLDELINTLEEYISDNS